jgi:tetratricopeptide (TPR) repeat protein
LKRLRDALLLAQDLQRRYPDNPYFDLVEGMIHVDYIGNYPQAISLLTRLRSDAREGRVLPAFASDIELRSRYYLGKAYLWKREYPRARDIFVEILAARPELPRWLIPWAHFRAGQAYDLMGERGKAITQYRAVLSGPEIGSLYTHARRQLKQPFTLAPGLAPEPSRRAG